MVRPRACLVRLMMWVLPADLFRNIRSTDIIRLAARMSCLLLLLALNLNTCPCRSMRSRSMPQASRWWRMRWGSGLEFLILGCEWRKVHFLVLLMIMLILTAVKRLCMLVLDCLRAS